MTQPTPEALEELVEREEWDAVLRVLRDGWVELMNSAPMTLSRVLSSLPRHIVENEPAFHYAIEYINRNNDDADTSLAYRRPPRAGAVPATPYARSIEAVAEMAEARSVGDHPRAIRLADVAHDALADTSGMDREFTSALPDFHIQIGITYEDAGRSDEALHHYGEAYDWAMTLHHAMAASLAASCLALTHAMRGAETEAERWAERSRAYETQEDGWWQLNVRPRLQLAGAHALLDTFEPEACMALLEAVEYERSPTLWWAHAWVIVRCPSPGTGYVGASLVLDDIAARMHAGVRSSAVNVARMRLFREVLGATHRRSARKPSSRDALPGGDKNAQRAYTLHTASQLLLARRGAAARQLLASLLMSRSGLPYVDVATAALLATTPDAAPEALEDAVALAVERRCLSPLLLLPDEAASRAADVLDRLGSETAAAVLRTRATAGGAREVLTKREHDVALLAAGGASNREISEALHVSAETVKSHLKHVYAKLGVSARTELTERLEALPSRP